MNAKQTFVSFCHIQEAAETELEDEDEADYDWRERVLKGLIALPNKLDSSDDSDDSDDPGTFIAYMPHEAHFTQSIEHGKAL